jgi:uncharacterized protein (TIGR02996 family)
MRQFTFSDAKSHKFWNIELQGNSFTVTYGRQGTAGQTQTKKFPDAAKAQKEHDKLIKEKLGKGYVEAGGAPAAPAGGGMREALEEALVADPDDLANHMAYADWLAEQGDPRGEFIQVQLALEDEKKSAAERKKLQKREQDLLKKHQREWLGELARFFLDGGDSEEEDEEHIEDADIEVKFRFARGWLDTVQVEMFTTNFIRTLAKAPQIRLLRRLELMEDHMEDPERDEPGDDITEGTDNPALYPLLRSPYLGNVRVLQLGQQEEQNGPNTYYNCHTSGEAAVGLVKRMPRLEELYLLAHAVDTAQLFGLKTLGKLRVLQVYHNHHYPLAKLAKNPSFGGLTHLLCHPHGLDDADPYIRLPELKAVVNSKALKSLTRLQLRLTDVGDKGCQEVVTSGVLKRLKVLDLRGGVITDAGARTLAACPDLRNLELLNLDSNCLTEEGVKALRAAGVKHTAAHQWAPTGNPIDDRMYLYEADPE